MNSELSGMILKLSENNFNDLSGKYHSEQAFAFIGSGLSRPAGLPAWESLLKKLAEKIKFNSDLHNDNSGPDMASVLRDEYEKQGRDFYEAIKDIFKETKTQPHLVIHEKLLNNKFKSCITTNFDDLLDSAAKSLNIPNYNPQIWPNFSITRLTEDKVCYIHGNLYNNNKIIFTRESYEEAYNNTTYIKRTLLAAAQENTFVFLGFSFEDSDFKNLLFNIGSYKKDDMWPNFGPHYALLPVPPDKIYFDKQLKKEYKHSVKIEIEETLSKLKIKPIFYLADEENHINLYKLLSYLMRMPTKPEILV